MKKLITTVLAIRPKILAGGGQAGAASLRQCLLSPFLAATNGNDNSIALIAQLTAGRGLPAAYRAATRSGGRFVGDGLLGIRWVRVRSAVDVALSLLVSSAPS